jgi:(heptosyl)LPS beta-1,4-glucosyltransferase
MENKISVVIPVKNEEFRIRRCLDSLKGWADEIVIIDDHSDDRTATIARDEYAAKVIVRSLGQDWAGQRNAGADVCRNDWVLQLDADEVVPSKTAANIKEILAQDLQAAAYTFTRINVLFGKFLFHCGAGEYTPLYDRRFASWEGPVHERLQFRGEPCKVNAFIEHYPADSVSYFLTKNICYADMAAQEFMGKAGGVDPKEIGRLLTFKALRYLWKSYVLKKGYKDGLEGLIWCILTAINSQIYWIMVYQKGHESGKTIRRR